MIALYMRLSMADGDFDDGKAESNSIANQRKILHSFVEADPALASREVREYVDDGFSGTSFARPQVQAMLDDVRHREIDTIVVKDLSRFAREYIDAGTYIEQVFPFMRVRFIAIADGYDSATCAPDSSLPGIAIRNIANASYSIDNSVRIKSTYKAKWKRGAAARTNVPFGFARSPDDPTRLVIDEEAAAIVRRAFELVSGGMSLSEAAKRLDAEGMETPGENMRRRKVRGYDKRPPASNPGWDTTKLRQILDNPVHKGVLVTHKFEHMVVGEPIYRRVPEEERYVIEDAHPAIVSPEVFERAQETMGGTKSYKKRKDAPQPPFTRLVVRAECGHKLRLCRYRNSSECMHTACKCDDVRRRVKMPDLRAAVAAALRGTGKGAGRGDEAGTDGTGAEDGGGVTAARTGKQPDQASVNAALRLAAYERMASGEISQADYRDYTAQLGERASVRRPAAGSAADLLMSRHAGGVQELVSQLEGGDIDRTLLLRFVKRILIHEGGRIEVVLADDV